MPAQDVLKSGCPEERSRYRSDPNATYLRSVIPAEAGIQCLQLGRKTLESLDFRFRGNDETRDSMPKKVPFRSDPTSERKSEVEHGVVGNRVRSIPRMRQLNLMPQFVQSIVS